MILAGDIGGTNARLAYFQSQNGNLRLISERVFPSREYTELGEIVSEFLEKTDARPDVACFGIAGPVHNGRVETSNLPWIIEQSRLAKQIQLPATLLINDLEANAWGIGELESARISLRLTLEPGSWQSGGHRTRNRPGRSGTVLERKSTRGFCLRGRTRRFRAPGRIADRSVTVPGRSLRTRQL